MATQLSLSCFAAGTCHTNKGRRMSWGHDPKGQQPGYAQPFSRCSSSHQRLAFTGYLHPPPKRDWKWCAQDSDLWGFGSTVGFFLLMDHSAPSCSPARRSQPCSLPERREGSFLSPAVSLSYNPSVCINTWHCEPQAVEEQSHLLIYQSILQG